MGKTVRDQDGQNRPAASTAPSPARRLPQVFPQPANDNRRKFGAAQVAIALLVAIAVVLVTWLSLA